MTHISTLQENTIAALTAIKRFMANKPTMAVLGNFQLHSDADAASIYLTAFSFEHEAVTIQYRVGAKVESPFSTTLPIKTTMDIVKQLPVERINWTWDHLTETTSLGCGRTDVKLNGITSDVMPPIPERIDQQWGVSALDLSTALEAVLPFCATEDNRPILTAINFRVENGTMTAATADGYTLGTIEVNVTSPDVVAEFNLHYKAMKSLLAVLKKDCKDYDVAMAHNTTTDVVQFESGSVALWVQNMGGRFPDYRAVIPRSWDARLTVFNSDLEKACKRTAIMARDSAGSVAFSFNYRGPQESAEFILHAKSMERGEITAKMDCGYDGVTIDAPITGACNVMNLAEVVKVSKQYERLDILWNGPRNPLTLRPQAEHKLTYIIMPMSVLR